MGTRNTYMSPLPLPLSRLNTFVNLIGVFGFFVFVDDGADGLDHADWAV